MKISLISNSADTVPAHQVRLLNPGGRIAAKNFTARDANSLLRLLEFAWDYAPQFPLDLSSEPALLAILQSKQVKEKELEHPLAGTNLILTEIVSIAIGRSDSYAADTRALLRFLNQVKVAVEIKKEWLAARVNSSPTLLNLGRKWFTFRFKKHEERIDAVIKNLQIATRKPSEVSS